MFESRSLTYGTSIPIEMWFSRSHIVTAFILQKFYEDWFTEGQSPNYDSARFTKACNINEIQRFAKIPETARD